MNPPTFYVTTPIYYVNDRPHIGHAYTTVLADVLARYHRLLGDDTHFLTGTDEHGQKVAKAAAAKGISPQQQADETVVNFQRLWVKLGITHDDFIRTTEERHTRIVQQVLQQLFDQGEIYRKEYVGWYSVSEERFFTEKDLVDGKPPEGFRDVERIVEPNYFFRMSKYQDWLVEYIQSHPEFIQPDFRRNETLGFLRQPLDDLCISRPKSRLDWGIELPFDRDFVTYVWFDALLNYVTAIGYGSDQERFEKWWPCQYHLIGKDILTTHTVYWPTMLKAAGIPLPRSIFAHGWWLVGRDKMSKTTGNVVNPMEMCDKYGVDPFRYFLMAEMTPGNDASFTEPAFVERYNTDLAGNVGNMTSRVAKMLLRECGGKLPLPGEPGAHEVELRDCALATVDAMAEATRELKLDRGLQQVIALVKACNRYFEQTTPWELKKQGDTARLHTVLYNGAEAMRIVAGLLLPVLPERMSHLRRCLGIDAADAAHPDLEQLRVWGVLEPGAAISDPGSLFPRLEAVAEPAAPPEPATPKKASAKSEEGANVTDLIGIEEFGRVQLRTAKVLAAEAVPDADKLLKLQLEVGQEQRQIVAGIARHYTPEEMVGKTIVIVANLQSATIRGIESNGMLLAAKASKKKLVLVTVDGECKSGAAIG